MEITLFILGIILIGLSVFLCLKPYIPSVITAYGAVWLMQWSDYLEFPNVMLSYWGILTMIIIVITSMQPEAMVKSTRGLLHITVGAVAGMFAGTTIGYSPMIIGTCVGALMGMIAYSRTKQGDALRPLTPFFKYFLAKGLPAIITIAMLGIILEVTMIQHA